MTKTFPFLLCLSLISACASTRDRPDAAEFEGFFADADHCFKTSIHKEQIKVPIGGRVKGVGTPGAMVIDVPLAHNPGAFSNCMVRAGHAPPKVSPQEYLEMSSRCLNEARGAENPDEAYGRCIRAGGLIIEPIIDEKTE